jgi:hypothetical protein
VLDMTHQSVEMLLAAQGQAPHPALELVGQAAQGGLEVAQRYVAMKERTAIAGAQATAAQAQAQAQAAQAQAQPRTGPGQTIATPALGDGAPAATEVDEDEEIASAEQTLFGPALPHVLELRQIVDSGGITPDQAAQAIITGISQLVDAGFNQLPILELWSEGHLAELVDVVIPDAKTSFQERMIEAIFKRRNELQRQQQAGEEAGASE